MTRIAFVGLGHMGNPIVRNLLKAGHEVTVYDVVSKSIAALTEFGARPAQSLAECAKEAEVIITMLQTGQQVQDVYLAKDGLLAHAMLSALLIDSSSIDVQTARSLNQTAAKLGFPMVDAPVSGGVAGAEAGTLTAMVGGDADAVEKAKPK